MAEDLRSEVAEWRKKSADLRAKLEKRRVELTRELAEVDAQLKVIPALPAIEDVSPAKLLVGIAVNIANELTLPAYIESVLALAPGGEMPSKALVEKVTQERGLDATRVHSELFRLKEKKRIGAKGERPNTVYFLPPKEAAVSP
jgi:hypothetical protein